VLTEINGVLGKIGEWLKSDEGKATVENVVTVITDSLKWIIDNKDSVVTALGAIVTGWGTLKLSGAAADALMLIKGLKGLSGGKAVGTGLGTAIGSKLAGSTALTSAATGATSVIGGMGLLPAVVTDMFLNQTNAGRGLLENGLSGLVDGIRQDLEDKGAEIQRNAETFASDTLNNRLMQGFLYQMTGGLFKTGNYNFVSEEEFQRMKDVADESNGEVVRSTSEMTQAANDMKGLPAQIGYAIESAMSRVTIVVDVDSMANALMPRIGGGMASTVLATVK
jgi:hypothetical protein